MRDEQNELIQKLDLAVSFCKTERMGIFAWIVFGVFIMLYRLNLKDVCSMQKRMEQGKHRLTFREEIGQLLDKKFYILVLALPVLGVCVFNILPIVFMILIAFTNYGGDIVPPQQH